MDRISTLSASGMASATELTVASLSNPTELNAIGLAVPDWRVCKTVSAGTDNAAWYRLDASSAAVDAPYIMASATTGLRWVAITGFSHGQPLNIKAPSVSTAVSVLANTNNFSEVNVQNLNSGGSASSDFVVTADNGSASTHYVDLGINCSTGGAAPFSTANGAYLYTTDNQLDISAQGASGLINLSVGATPTIVAAFDVTNGVTFNDKTTATKQLRLQLASQTAATILTLNTGAQTASRQISVPVLAANDTFAILGAQTFTGAQTIGTVSSSLAGLSVGLTVGATNAQFGNTFGLFFISNYPQIAYNGYYNGGFKAHTAGYVATNVFDPTVGTLTLACSTTAPITDGAATMTNLLTLSKIGDAGFLSSTASTSTTTGALVVTGGVGVGGRLNIGSAVTINGTSASGYLDLAGGGSATRPGLSYGMWSKSSVGLAIYSGNAGRIDFEGTTVYAQFGDTTCTFAASTASTSTTTGALVVTGGIGCGGRVTVDGASTKTLKYVNGVANAAVAVLFGAIGPTGSTAGNAQGWIRIDVAGTDRYIPYW